MRVLSISTGLKKNKIKGTSDIFPWGKKGLFPFKAKKLAILDYPVNAEPQS